MIEAPQVVDGAIGTPARQIATAVHPFAGRPIGVGDKAFGSQGCTALITPRQINPGDVQLPRHAHRHRVEIGVENMDLRIGDRTPDRHAVAVLATGP